MPAHKKQMSEIGVEDKQEKKKKEEEEEEEEEQIDMRKRGLINAAQLPKIEGLAIVQTPQIF
jgi:hypothetical protein